MNLKEILPLLEKGYTIKQIAKKYKRTPMTIHRWINKLKEAGHPVKIRRGRPITLKI